MDMTLFDKPYVTYYQWFVVAVFLSCTLFETLILQCRAAYVTAYVTSYDPAKSFSFVTA